MPNSGKTKSKNSLYPLQPIQVPSEPFQKIIVDCVGPLPKTEKGNQYISPAMCPTTTYPEAFPCPASCSYVHYLWHSSGSAEWPRYRLHQRTLWKGIKQTLSTACDAESQGALARWHQTAKSLLRKYCFENQESWDEGLPFMLFAIREAPHGSLGFSPV